MNRSKLIDRLTACLPDIPRRDVDQSVRLLVDQVFSTLVAGGRCEVRGFGTFSIHTCKARIGRNPKTGDSIALPEKHKAHFKPGKLLREEVNLGRLKNPIKT